MFRAAALASALTLAAAVPAHAQSAPTVVPDLSHPDWAEYMGFLRAARARALELYPRLMCGDVMCAPATAEELANPPISDEDLFRIGMVGMRSAMAEHCGLEWERSSFLPMMSEWRQRDGRTDRDFALVAATHGVIQQSLIDVYVTESPCDERMRTELQAAMR